MKNREKKYKAIVHFVEDRILSGEYRIGDKLPSVNALKIRFDLSRSSVFMAMDELESRGLIEAEPSVGYFISSEQAKIKENILLLFNEFNTFKEDIYQAFIADMGSEVSVDILFHNFNRGVFETLLKNANGKYTTYVVMPGKFKGLGQLLDSISGRVILLDHFCKDIAGAFPSVGQNFAEDTRAALLSEADTIRKYKKIILVQSTEKEPEERYDGIKCFCEDYGLEAGMIPGIAGRKIVCGDLFITPEERELVNILKQADSQGLVIGKDFGIISYNDTPMKEILSGGITTITSDFRKMGRTLARIVKEKLAGAHSNPCKLIIRNSI